MLERRRLCARTGKRSLIGKPLRHRCALLYGLSQLSGEGGDLLACAALRKIGKRLRTGMPQQVDLLVHQAELIGKRYGLFTEKLGLDGVVPVILAGDDEVED